MRTTPDAVMLFAAGFGTRMGALTAARPKPLIEVAGKPLIDHALDQVRDYGAHTVVANAHYLSAQITDHLKGTDVQVSVEAPDILDTGGGLRAALPLLGPGPVFTMNTDAVWSGPNPLSILAQAWRPDRMQALLLCVPPSRAYGHLGTGDFTIAADGHARRGPGAIYTGVQIIRTDRLDGIAGRAFSLNLLWDAMQADQGLFAVPYPGKWCDVGHPEGIPVAEAMLRAGNV